MSAGFPMFTESPWPKDPRWLTHMSGTSVGYSMAGASLGLSSTRSLAPASSLRAAREGKQKPQASQGLGLAGGPSCWTLWQGQPSQCARQLRTAVNSERWGSWGVIWGSHPEPCPINTIEVVPTGSDSHLWSELPPSSHSKYSTNIRLCELLNIGLYELLFNVLKKDIRGVDFEVMTQRFKRPPCQPYMKTRTHEAPWVMLLWGQLPDICEAVASPGLPVSCSIRDHGVIFKSAKVSCTVCWWQQKSQLDFLWAGMRMPDSPHWP